jgi:NAD-dependent DNA ligase
VENFLAECREQYHKGNPIIDDVQYDELERIYGEEGVGHGVPKDAVPHLSRMYSLKKFYEEEDSPPIIDSELIESYKLDGAAISLLYSNGNLVRALTRGDGYKGTDITDKVKLMKDIPLEINNTDTIQITGEVVASKDIPNSRNYASGAMNLKSLEEFVERTVHFYAYGVEFIEYGGDYTNDMLTLKYYGFNTVLDLHLNNPIPFPTDGIVVRVNSNQIFGGMGFTSKHPRGAWAIKERSEGVETVLNEVIWQVGKSGKVTPVAILEPVEIDGAVVGRATLNNIGFIRGLNLSIGDTVRVERAGGIIPRIISKVS